jgi:hypothetical protein
MFKRFQDMQMIGKQIIDLHNMFDNENGDFIIKWPKNGGALHRKIAGMTDRKYFGLNCL